MASAKLRRMNDRPPRSLAPARNQRTEGPIPEELYLRTPRETILERELRRVRVGLPRRQPRTLY